MGREFEIKLSGEEAVVRGLERSLVLRALAIAPATAERLETVYVDTEDRALSAMGACLRRRLEDGAPVQSLKMETAGFGALDRLERETPLERGDDFPVATGVEAVDRLIEARRADLRPVMAIETERRAVIIERRGVQIEAAMDLCVATSPESGQGRFAEIELELLTSQPDAAREAFNVARLLVEEARGGLRPCVATKRARAAAATADGSQTVGPENRILIDPDGDAGGALAAAVAATAQRVATLAGPLAVDADAEAGRQMRVALRRFRSIERIFRKAADAPRLRALALSARDASRIVGAARDWDIFLAHTLPECEEANPDLRTAAGFAALRLEAERRWDSARREAAEFVAAPAFSAFTLDLLEEASLAPWRDRKPLRKPVARFAARALDVRLEAAHALAHGLGDAAPTAGHPLRIALKKLRYTAQLFRDLYPKAERRAFMAAMSALQDDFGALNDAVVAQGLAFEAASGAGVADGRAALARAAGFIAGYKAAAAGAAARAAFDRWAAFAAIEPFWRRGEGGVLERLRGHAHAED